MEEPPFCSADEGDKPATTYRTHAEKVLGYDYGERVFVPHIGAWVDIGTFVTVRTAKYNKRIYRILGSDAFNEQDKCDVTLKLNFYRNAEWYHDLPKTTWQRHTTEDKWMKVLRCLVPVVAGSAAFLPEVVETPYIGYVKIKDILDVELAFVFNHRTLQDKYDCLGMSNVYLCRLAIDEWITRIVVRPNEVQEFPSDEQFRLVGANDTDYAKRVFCCVWSVGENIRQKLSANNQCGSKSDMNFTHSIPYIDASAWCYIKRQIPFMGYGKDVVVEIDVEEPRNQVRIKPGMTVTRKILGHECERLKFETSRGVEAFAKIFGTTSVVGARLSNILPVGVEMSVGNQDRANYISGVPEGTLPVTKVHLMHDGQFLVIKATYSRYVYRQDPNNYYRPLNCPSLHLYRMLVHAELDDDDNGRYFDMCSLPEELIDCAVVHGRRFFMNHTIFQVVAVDKKTGTVEYVIVSQCGKLGTNSIRSRPGGLSDIGRRIVAYDEGIHDIIGLRGCVFTIETNKELTSGYKVIPMTGKIIKTAVEERNTGVNSESEEESDTDGIPLCELIKRCGDNSKIN